MMTFDPVSGSLVPVLRYNENEAVQTALQTVSDGAGWTVLTDMVADLQVAGGVDVEIEVSVMGTSISSGFLAVPGEHHFRVTRDGTPIELPPARGSRIQCHGSFRGGGIDAAEGNTFSFTVTDKGATPGLHTYRVECYSADEPFGVNRSNQDPNTDSSPAGRSSIVVREKAKPIPGGV